MSKIAHSKLGASSYYRWSACPGSVKLSEDIEEVESVYAAEGTRAHDYAAAVLTAQAAPFNLTVEHEMAEAVEVYLEHVFTLRAQKPSFEAVEQKLSLAEYHPHLYGTADYVAYFSRTKTLHVVDYKHGAGIPVEVIRSKQLMYYGLGALHANKFPIEKIVLTIVQPRCYHPGGPVRSWETDPADMIDFAASLIEDAEATEKINAPLATGDHCRFCPAQPVCPAVQRQALEVAQSNFSDISLFDADKVGRALSLIPQVKAWCEAVNTFAHQQATLGNLPTGWKLVDKRAMRKWKEDFDPVILQIETGIDAAVMYERKLKSPAQMEKFLAKGEKSLLDTFVVKESSGTTLVPCADDRDPRHVTNAFQNEELIQ